MTTNDSQHYNQPHDISAYKAKFEALKIAFSPVIFQVSISLLELGILDQLNKAGEKGLSIKTIAESLKLTEYGVGVLLDAALSAHILWLDENSQHYILDKIGMMLLSDQMVRVNLDFNQHLCYEGLFHLTESITAGKPKGLKVFDETASSIYPLLTQLPKKAQQSWFNFDHYYSDKSFKALLPILFNPKHKPKTLLDIGGNTGKWAIQCFKYDPDITITLVDLEEQLIVANNNIKQHGFNERFSSYHVNLLEPQAKLPKTQTYDFIWMSQFLDCFSLDEIAMILSKVAEIMTDRTKLGILELFWDRQIFEPAAFAINCTSIYFTALANGNSRMYHSKDLIKLIHQAGLYIDYDEDTIGPGHTLLICKKKI
ncbi:class I SAM-dependent methyltransferase [Thiotrichales bacterium 19S3-7]|nr:class I SAM-dependent methyltransferase [Thiotrichales bacterium 19S3-7]MCF6802198.1 class I SAM-dependent methyltransferase [Thiotrichales bacterium 19S3-11]